MAKPVVELSILVWETEKFQWEEDCGVCFFENYSHNIAKLLPYNPIEQLIVTTDVNIEQTQPDWP